MTRFTMFVVVLCTTGAISAAQDNPVKLATTARFDVMADSGASRLDDGQLLAGNGSAVRMNWIAESDRPRSYTVNFSATHLGWREFAVRFTPARSGNVTLSLMGPWQEVSSGRIYKQEVYWDAVSVDGAAIENGGFESGRGAQVPGWQSNGGTVEAPGDMVTAHEGRQVARTWHNATLTTRLEVQAAKPVTIRGYVRAVTPSGFREMRRITDHDTPAHRAAKLYLRGTNLGNYLEAPPGQNWGASYSPEDFDHIKAEGFDHVRLPIAWHHYTGDGPEYRIQREFFSKADFLVDQATKRGLAAIVNIHHFDAFTSDPAGQQKKFLAIWAQLAEHYAQAAPTVAFELLNEPKDAATTEILNPIYADAVRQIRKTNPTRPIFVGPGRWNQVEELTNLRLPDDDANIIVTVHCYEPFQFTHQGASWAGGEVRQLKGIRFPGPPERPLEPDPQWRLSAGTLDWIKRYNTLPTDANPSAPRAFRGSVRQAKEWSDYYGRPVHVGEFGAYIGADAESRARFYASFREALDETGMGWAMWDWKAGFHYWDDRAGRPAPGMHDALFPPARR